MNERINELAIQAGGIWRGGYVEQHNGDSVWTDRKFAVDVDTEQFARLLIQDCIDCVDGYTKPRTFGTHYDAVEQIKANFGIEK